MKDSDKLMLKTFEYNRKIAEMVKDDGHEPFVIALVMYEKGCSFLEASRVYKSFMEDDFCAGIFELNDICEMELPCNSWDDLAAADNNEEEEK